MRIKRVALAIIALIIGLVGVWLLESQTKLFHRWLDEQVYDNRNHYLPCDTLPTEAEVRLVMSENTDLVAQIQAVNPGNVGVEVGIPDCPGKADMLIWYSSHRDREEIETILGSESFFGIPIRLQNR